LIKGFQIKFIKCFSFPYCDWTYITVLF